MMPTVLITLNLNWSIEYAVNSFPTAAVAAAASAARRLLQQKNTPVCTEQICMLRYQDTGAMQSMYWQELCHIFSKSGQPCVLRQLIFRSIMGTPDAERRQQSYQVCS